jgi:hypothetical protein
MMVLASGALREVPGLVGLTIERILHNLGITAKLEAESPDGEPDYGGVLQRVHTWWVLGDTVPDESEQGGTEPQA